jgi:hypothetical protein
MYEMRIIYKLCGLNISYYTLTCCEPDSCQYNVWQRAGRPGDQGSIPGRGEMICSLASVSRTALGPTQPPVQRVPGVLSLGLKRGRGVTLTTHPDLVPRSRMSTSYTSLPSRHFIPLGFKFCKHPVLKHPRCVFFH